MAPTAALGRRSSRLVQRQWLNCSSASWTAGPVTRVPFTRYQRHGLCLRGFHNTHGLAEQRVDASRERPAAPEVSSAKDRLQGLAAEGVLSEMGFAFE